MIPQLIKQAQALLIFLQDSAVFTTSEDGHTYIKQIDFTNLIEILGQKDFQSDWHLQPNVALHKVCQYNGKIMTVSSVLPSQYLLRFDNFSLNVPLPGAVVVHKQSRLWIFAYKGQLSLNSQLYQFPLPNINSDGQVCWGSVSPPNKDTASMWHSFISSEFNYDLDGGKSLSHPNLIVDKLIRISQSLVTVYPEQDLVPNGWSLNTILQLPNYN
jgi:Prokaryotic E2 family D